MHYSWSSSFMFSFTTSTNFLWGLGSSIFHILCPIAKSSPPCLFILTCPSGVLMSNLVHFGLSYCHHLQTINCSRSRYCATKPSLSLLLPFVTNHTGQSSPLSPPCLHFPHSLFLSPVERFYCFLLRTFIPLLSRTRLHLFRLSSTYSLLSLQITASSSNILVHGDFMSRSVLHKHKQEGAQRRFLM